MNDLTLLWDLLQAAPNLGKHAEAFKTAISAATTVEAKTTATISFLDAVSADLKATLTDMG